MTTRNIQDICEKAIVELEAAVTSFDYLWEQHFGFTEKPTHWNNDFHAIAAAVTAHKMLLEHISDTLLTAYGMAPKHCAADYKLLYEESQKMWPEKEMQHS